MTKSVEAALRYERHLSETKQKSNKRLSQQADAYERKLTDEQIHGAVSVRDKALAYERRITDQQFANIEHVNEEHRVYHEREHILYDDAVEKASASLTSQLASLQVELDRMQLQMQSLMPIGRFEREHAALMERVDTKFGTYDEKLNDQEKVTVRQDTTQELLNRIAETSGTNRRWMIGLMVSTGATFMLLAAHLLHLY
jgi:hypothetical protein